MPAPDHHPRPLQTPPTVFGFRKLPPRAALVVTPLILSILMTSIVSLISTLNGVGLTPGFLDLWLRAWGLSWIVAFPVLLFVLPAVRRVTAALVHLP
jgi:hypothetical protein